MRGMTLSKLMALTTTVAAVSCVAETEGEHIEAIGQGLLGAGTGLSGEYYDNVDFTALKLTRTDSTIRFNWAAGSPSPSIAADTFSVRWTGKVEPDFNETYTFYVMSDDGVRLWVGDQLVIDAWTDRAATESRGIVALTAGQLTNIRLEYYDAFGSASVQLSWSSASQAKRTVPRSRLYPAGTGGGGTPDAGSKLPDAGTTAEAGTTTPEASTAPPNTGSGPTSGMARPSYNKGTGFFVVGNKLYDANGNEFRIRGVNHLHWDAPGIGIPKTGANTERWVIDFGQSASTNVGLMQKSIANKIVPMPGNWDGTCNESSSTLSNIVSRWVATAPQWKTVEKYILINIANEWGPSNSTVWRDQYISAIAQLRAAGINSTIVVDAGGCGQDNPDLAQYATAVFDSDPQKNVIFDQHIYGLWQNGGGASWQTDLKAGLDALVATGLPYIIGEFGPGREIGPSPTSITPGQIIQAAEARGFGWLAWAWDDPAGEFTSAPTDNWFALSFNGDFRSSADLTVFGKDVVENSTYGLKKLARPATTF
jgi:hypothetical protein